MVRKVKLYVRSYCYVTYVCVLLCSSIFAHKVTLNILNNWHKSLTCIDFRWQTINLFIEIYKAKFISFLILCLYELPRAGHSLEICLVIYDAL